MKIIVDKAFTGKRVAILMCFFVSTFTAVQAGGFLNLNWVSNSNGNWFDQGNWVESLVPEDGDSVRFGLVNPDFAVENVDIDNGGAGINLPNSTLRIERKVNFSDASAGGDPELADDGMVFDIIRINGSGGRGVIFDVPVTANQVSSNRHGGIFNREIAINEILATSGHQDNWQINASATQPVNYILVDENRGPDGDTINSAFNINSDLEVRLLEHVWSRVRIGVNAFVEVDRYVYNSFINQAEDNNINPLTINGTLRVEDFIVFDVASETSVGLEIGTYGSLDNENTDFQTNFINGDGMLIVHDDDVLFRDGFESSVPTVF